MFLLWLRQLPHCGDWTPASVPPPAEGRSSPTDTPVFPPSSVILPSCAWFYIFFFFFFFCFFRFYIFFSTGQVLLSALCWCSTCTSVSEGVFLMYLWREMYSMSTYSFSILFSNLWFLFEKNIALFFLKVFGLIRICTISFKVSFRLLHPKITSYINTVFPKPGSWHWNNELNFRTHLSALVDFFSFSSLLPQPISFSYSWGISRVQMTHFKLRINKNEASCRVSQGACESGIVIVIVLPERWTVTSL